MMINKLFIADVVNTISACDKVEIEYEGGLVWRLDCQMKGESGVKSALVDDDDLTYLQKHHRELCESRGIVFDEDEAEEADEY